MNVFLKPIKVYVGDSFSIYCFSKLPSNYYGTLIESFLTPIMLCVGDSLGDFGLSQVVPNY